MADATTGTGAGGAVVQPPAAAPVTTPAPSSEEEELRFSKTAFDKRLEQAQRSAELKALKALGFDSLEAAQAFRASADKAAQDADAKRKAEMDELTRLKTELQERDAAIAAERAKATAAAEDAEMARTEARLQRLYAEREIKGTGADYAEFLLVRATEALKDGEMLDEVDFLDRLVKDPVEAARLGITTAMAPVVTPASTTNPHEGPAPKPPQQTSDQKHASQMSDEEWRRWLANPTQ
jgi:hypothetical protein